MKKSKRRRRLIVLSLLGALILFRLFLPQIVLNYVNHELSELEGYSGSVEDIDLALYRGAYVAEGLDIRKRLVEPNHVLDTIPFFYCGKVDLSLEWSALFRGRLVGEIVLQDARLNFVKDFVEQGEVEDDSSDFRRLLKTFMPLEINRFETIGGELNYLDPFSDPPVNLKMDSLHILALNLSNVRHRDKLLPSGILAESNVYGGKFSLEVGLDALATTPTFDLNAELTTVDIRNLNDFFRAYGHFDAEEGKLSLYTEMAAREGRIEGYVKPLVTQLRVANWKEDRNKPLQFLWESMIGLGAELFQNQPKDQLGTRVEVEGRANQPHMGIMSLVMYTLRNAFVSALRPAIEGSIDINTPNEKPGASGLEGQMKKLTRIFNSEEDPKEPNE